MFIVPITIHTRQVFASWSTKSMFGLGTNDVTADYATTDVPGMISVISQCKPPSILSSFHRVEGVAIQSTRNLGAFSVSFSKKSAVHSRVHSHGNYWIIKLGPIIDGACAFCCAISLHTDTLICAYRFVRLRHNYERTTEDEIGRAVSGQNSIQSVLRG